LALALVFALSLTAIWVCALPLGRVLRGQNDFLALYSGAKLAGTPALYSVSAAKDLQAELGHIWLPAVIYTRPPFYAVLLKPLTALPYRVAYGLFQALNLAALAAFLWFWARRDKLLCVLGGVSIPVVTAFANGQDVLLLVLICAAAWELERRQRLFLAGLLLSLLAVKFHLFLFVPVVLLVHQRWRMLWGGVVGAAALLGVSAIFQGWDWPAGYIRLLRSPEITPTPITMANLHGLLMATVGDLPRVELILAALVAFVVIWSLLCATPGIRGFGPALALAIVAGLLTSHHAYVQDSCLLLLIPVLAPEYMWTRRIALALLTPPAYFLLMADGPVSALVPLGIVALFAMLAWEAARGRTATVLAGAIEPTSSALPMRG
jgi:hypothetical protein